MIHEIRSVFHTFFSVIDLEKDISSAWCFSPPVIRLIFLWSRVFMIAMSFPAILVLLAYSSVASGLTCKSSLHSFLHTY